MGDFPLLAFSALLPGFNCAVPLLPSRCPQNVIVSQGAHRILHAGSQALKHTLRFSVASPRCMLPLYIIFFC